MPQKEAGMRREPYPSLPTAKGPIPQATAAAEPELEPPGVRSRFQGFRVAGKTGLTIVLLIVYGYMPYNLL